MANPGPRTALVLGGGGARGAYEAGVLRYLHTELARDLGFQPRFDVVCGTSVGAINACHVAVTAHDPAAQVQQLHDFWSEISIDSVFQLSGGHVTKLPRWLMGQVRGRMSVVSTQPLEQLVTRSARWGRVRKNIREHHLDAVTVTATRVADGRATVFYESTPGLEPTPFRGPHIEARRVRIGPRYALASAAIPLLFPAVPINGQLYYDGGLVQNTPLLPALAFGAERILIICIDRLVSGEPLPEEKRPVPRKPVSEVPYPSAPELFGKMLDAMLLDHVHRDLDRLQQRNAFIAAARERLGDAVVQQLQTLSEPFFESPLQQIDALCLEPSVEIAPIAERHFKGAEASTGGLGRQFLQRLQQASGEQGGHLPSYYLFYGPYTQELIELAIDDCRRQHDALLAFFRGGRLGGA